MVALSCGNCWWVTLGETRTHQPVLRLHVLDRERRASEFVMAIVNEVLVKKSFPNGGALGRHFTEGEKRFALISDDRPRVGAPSVSELQRSNGPRGSHAGPELLLRDSFAPSPMAAGEFSRLFMGNRFKRAFLLPQPTPVQCGKEFSEAGRNR
jgi:hypothetical protein